MTWSEAARALSPASFWIPDDLCASAWTEHAPFAFWLTETVRPRSFVELGTHNGYSFFAVCQAVERLGLGTAAYAVDNWMGDEHAGFYDESVFRSVTARNARYGAFASLIRSTFDAALPYFADRSIDLLHIDGRHGYDDVKHDFESWRDKLAPHAVVLFHDTNVRERGFGVWRYFDELARDHASFRFVHGHGLGILAAGGAGPPGLAPLFDARVEAADLIRAAYSALGGALAVRQQLAQRERRTSGPGGSRDKQSGSDDAAPARARRGLTDASAPETAPAAGPGNRAKRKARVIVEGRAVPRRS